MDAKKKSKKRAIASAGVVVAILILAITFVWTTITRNRFNVALSAGEQYLIELDYRHAIASFEKALTIIPNAKVAQERLVETADLYVDELIADGNYDEARKVIDDVTTFISRKEYKEVVKKIKVPSNPSFSVQNASRVYDYEVEFEDGDIVIHVATESMKYPICTATVDDADGFIMTDVAWGALSTFEEDEDMAIGEFIPYSECEPLIRTADMVAEGEFCKVYRHVEDNKNIDYIVSEDTSIVIVIVSIEDTYMDYLNLAYKDAERGYFHMQTLPKAWEANQKW